MARNIVGRAALLLFLLLIISPTDPAAAATAPDDVALVIPPTPLSAFILAAYLVIALPGPAVLYVVARSVDQGLAAGLVSVVGVSVGSLAQAVASAVGLTALLALSGDGLTVLRLLGAAYLLWLGVRTLRRGNSTAEEALEPQPLLPVFRQGVLVNLLNPHLALFFLAFLPQFTDPARGSVALQSLGLGLVFVTIALCNHSLYALAAGRLAARLELRGTRATGRTWAAGGIYIALGLAATLLPSV